MSMNRRSFVKGAATAAAATAAASIAAPVIASAEEAAVEEIAPVATYTCDTVVVGGGIAGLAAGLQSAQEGMGTIVLEKQTALGGGGRGTEGVFGVGSTMQKEQGIDCEPRKVMAKEMSYHHGRVSGARWLNLIQASGENIDWLQEAGVAFTGQVDNYRGGDMYTFHWWGENRGGWDYAPQMRAAIESLGGEIQLSMTAKHVVCDEDGGVCGLLAQKWNGDWVRYSCSNVMVATGGYANNHELLARSGFPHAESAMAHLEGRFGDGLTMVEEIGGELNLGSCAYMMMPSTSSPEGNGAGVFGKARDGLVCAARYMKNLWMDQTGQRCCAENAGDENWQALGIPLLVNDEVWSVFDDAIFDESYSFMPRPFFGPEVVRAQLDERVATNVNNDFFKADTIEELAEKVCGACSTMDAERFVATFNRYQENCAAGVDLDYDKPEQYLQVMEPPFYCVRMFIFVDATFGGIKVTNDMQCLRDGEPIKGMYACGTESAMLWPNIYTINVPAGANGNNVNSGRLAARHASAAMGDAKLGTVSAEGDTAPSVPGYKFETPEAMADGVYTASAMGKDGDIDVTVTVEGNRIVAVEETNTYETPYIGNHAMDDIVIPAILEKGNLDITCDTFSGATLSCLGLLHACADCCEQAAAAL